MEKHHIDEQELIRLIGSGSGDAMAIIYRRHLRTLFVYAAKLVQDEDEAFDFVHDTFLTFYTKIRTGELVIHTSLSAFLHQSLRNRIFDRIDHTRVADRYYSLLKNKFEAGELTTENYLRDKETRKRIEDGLNSLPPLTREIFVMSNIENRTYHEISREKSISMATVKRRLKEAKTFLQTRLTAFFMTF